MNGQLLCLQRSVCDLGGRWKRCRVVLCSCWLTLTLHQEIRLLFRSHLPLAQRCVPPGRSGGSSTSAPLMAAARRREGEQSRKQQGDLCRPQPEGAQELLPPGFLHCVGVGTLCAVCGAPKLLFLARKRRKAGRGRLTSSHRFSMGQR